MNDGTAKEACTVFNVSPKSLSHIMLGKRYAGESARDPTQWPVKVTWQGNTPNLPQESKGWWKKIISPSLQ